MDHGQFPDHVLYRHAEPLSPEAVPIVDGRFVFVDPADQDLGAGTWTSSS